MKYQVILGGRGSETYVYRVNEEQKKSTDTKFNGTDTAEEIKAFNTQKKKAQQDFNKYMADTTDERLKIEMQIEKDKYQIQKTNFAKFIP